MSGDSAKDIRKANQEMFGQSDYPDEWKDYIWHHNYDGLMILIPKDLHEYIRQLPNYPAEIAHLYTQHILWVMLRLQGNRNEPIAQ